MACELSQYHFTSLKTAKYCFCTRMCVCVCVSVTGPERGPHAVAEVAGEELWRGAACS